MGKIKVHLGCWHRYIPGFIHVDLCNMPHIDYASNIDKLPFFENNSVDLIYCSHALEYFDRDEVLNVLTEWNRVLCPGGLIRLAVPDFEALIKIYTQTGDLKRVLGPLYGKMEIDTSNGANILYHKTTYDEQSLSELLIQTGFVSPHRWNWRNTEHASIDDHSQAYYPHMQKDSGILVSLNIEAIKK
jgi:ubiquinone/menaquinone biosynthesis C-methylase UbiE